VRQLQRCRHRWSLPLSAGPRLSLLVHPRQDQQATLLLRRARSDAETGTGVTSARSAHRSRTTPAAWRRRSTRMVCSFKSDVDRPFTGGRQSVGECLIIERNTRYDRRYGRRACRRVG
jgi:hypothetical protein